MRHHNKNKKFGRVKTQRNALLRSLSCALIRDEKIVTTETKAKALRPLIEKMVTHAKSDTVSSRRFVNSKVANEDLTNKLFTEIAPKYQKRNGGYTRIVKLPIRKSDASKMAQIEFV